MTKPVFNQQQLMGLDTSHLIELYPNHFVHKQVAEPIKALQLEAQLAGFDLRLASSFRSFERQQLIWNDKTQGKRPVFDRQQQQVDLSKYSEIDAINKICIYSAIPGFSRHHWGTDFDVYDAKQFDAKNRPQLTADEYQTGGPNYPMYQWLLENMSKFGFVHVFTDNQQTGVAAEPWHISHLPTAKIAQQAFKLAECKQILSEQPLAYKQTLLDNLADLYQTYVEAYYV